MEAYLGTIVNGLCSAAFAAAMAVVLTAPARYVIPSFLCGLAAQVVRGLLTTAGMDVGGATLVASAVAVVAAVGVTPRHSIEPVVLIAGVLPLGAGSAVFNTIVELVHISAASGPALNDASMTMMGNLGRAFTTLVAIAVGLQIGIVLVRPILPEYQRDHAKLQGFPRAGAMRTHSER